MSCLVREENMFSATLAEGWLRSLHAKHKRTLWKTDLLLTCWACQAITNSIKNVMNHICFWAKRERGREREREKNWCWGWRHAKIQMIKELDVPTIRGRHSRSLFYLQSKWIYALRLIAGTQVNVYGKMKRMFQSSSKYLHPSYWI